MATLSKRYSFASGTDAVAAEVNTNFDDIISFCNNSVAHLDGSKAFTGIPSLPASDPTSDNQAVRKKYVDDHLPKGGVHSGTTNAFGTIDFPHGMGAKPSAVVCVGAVAFGDDSRLPSLDVHFDETNITVHCWHSDGERMTAGRTLSIRWIALP